MDTIHRKQPEHTRQDLTGPTAVQRIKDMVDDARSGFFTTAGGHTRPMSPLQVDDAGNLWFMTASDGHILPELAASPQVRLNFQASGHSGFLYLDGTATVTRDPTKIKELWNFTLKTWFTEGEDDPRIALVKVAPGAGYYWDNKHGNIVAGAKMMVGAVLGATLDDSIEGALQV